jgi:hypothetical protein
MKHAKARSPISGSKKRSVLTGLLPCVACTASTGNRSTVQTKKAAMGSRSAT